jgi:hypothetical protein
MVYGTIARNQTMNDSEEGRDIQYNNWVKSGDGDFNNERIIYSPIY